MYRDNILYTLIFKFTIHWHNVKCLIKNRRCFFTILQRVVQWCWRKPNHIWFPFILNHPIIREILKHRSHHLRSSWQEQQRQLCSTVRSLARCDNRKSTPCVFRNLVHWNEVLRLFQQSFQNSGQFNRTLSQWPHHPCLFEDLQRTKQRGNNNRARDRLLKPLRTADRREFRWHIESGGQLMAPPPSIPW